jgi:NAD-reducing hydrogenase small subunit
MSFLDIDERILALADRVDLVYSPLVDNKVFPEDVDITLVEGAVSNDDDLHKIKMVRDRTKTLVSLGDCAVTANVPAMRNPFRKKEVPQQVVPPLLPYARPIHEIVPVDVFVPGCPPSADTIFWALTEILEGRHPELSAKTRFGA